jgi:hypothetical protein
MGRCYNNALCDCRRCQRKRQENYDGPSVSAEPRRKNRRSNRNPRTSDSEVGARWTADDGTTHTVNPTSDPQVPGGYYHSQTDSDGNKSTAVFDSDDTLADIKQNKDWW